MTTPKTAGVLTRRCYFNAFCGKAVSTTAGLAVLNVIEKEKLQENASMVGKPQRKTQSSEIETRKLA